VTAVGLALGVEIVTAAAAAAELAIVAEVANTTVVRAVLVTRIKVTGS
jgi:hypothetical protein